MSARPVIKTTHMNQTMQEYAIMAAQVRTSLHRDVYSNLQNFPCILLNNEM
jgi:hypothetical protein